MKHSPSYLLGLIFSQSLSAASIQINWSIDLGRELYNQFATPLSAGSAIDGDGTLLQLGFYTGATTADPFVGSWVLLATSSVGDTGVNQAGRFSVSTTLVEGTFTAPAAGTPLAIRYYDGLTAATSAHFNAASDTTGAWNWVAPALVAPVLDLKITKLNTVFQSGVVGAFQTEIGTGVPEPASGAFLLAGGIALTFRRRRLATDSCISNGR